MATNKKSQKKVVKKASQKAQKPKRDLNAVAQDMAASLRDPKFVANALLDCTKDCNEEAFENILLGHLKSLRESR